MTEVISREEAKSRGLMHFFTGKICKHGHVSKRFVSNGHCYECNLANRPFRKKYEASHQYKKAKKKYDRSSKGRYSNAARKKRYNNTHHGKVRNKLSVAKKRTKRLGAATETDLLKIFDQAKRCHICGKLFTKRNPPSLDHVIALARGGTNEPSNLAAAHLRCNIRKQAQRTHLL